MCRRERCEKICRNITICRSCSFTFLSGIIARRNCSYEDVCKCKELGHKIYDPPVRKIHLCCVQLNEREEGEIESLDCI